MCRWKPRDLKVTNAEGSRSPSVLDAVLDELQVETEPRYQANGPMTWCNLAAWDATRALGCEVPHWHRSKELTANGMILWLRTEGIKHGWHHVDAESAKYAASRGEPVVATWENVHGGSGHIAMLRPMAEDGPILICQAGRKNLNRAPIADGFGKLPVVFYAHP